MKKTFDMITIPALLVAVLLAALTAFAADSDIDDFLRSPVFGQRLNSHRNLRDLVDDYARIEKRRARESERLAREWKDITAEIIRNIQRYLKAEEEHNARISEMKMGLYCSQCNRSKSQIEKSGENFYSHLQSVRGREKTVPLKLIQDEERKFYEYGRREARKRLDLDHLADKNDEKADRVDREAERDKAVLEKKIQEYIVSGNAADLGSIPLRDEDKPQVQEKVGDHYLSDKEWYGEE